MVTTILNTTILSNFAHCRQPDLLQLALGEDVATTSAVLAELRSGEALGLVPRCDWRWLRVVALTEEEQSSAGEHAVSLDAGESACLAVARNRGWTFLTDDFAARRLAQREGVAFSGTLGVLQKLVAQEHLTIEEADRVLAVMISQGYRAPIRSLRELLA